MIAALTDDQRKRIAGHVLVASISGGKDSAAMSLWLTEQGLEHRRVFADTGWEHPWTYDYLRGPLTAALGPIDEVSGPLKMAALIQKKGMFPSRLHRFCTSELKVKPLVAYHVAVEDDRVNVVGIRRAESRARDKVVEWEWSDAFDCNVWRPILHWSEQDVFDFHRKHGLRPCPLYLRGASRVGCWPCIFARKAEIALCATLSPDRISEIRSLEAELCALQLARRVRDGRTSPWPPPPTFFRPSGLAPETRDFTPIDHVVEWAHTARGGRQMLLLDTEPDGCVKWGLCEGAIHDKSN